MPKNESAVEGFKLTSEQKTWFKDYKRVNQVTEMIGKGLRIEYGKMQMLQKLFKQAQGLKATMLKQAPTNQINEIEGQEGPGPGPEQREMRP